MLGVRIKGVALVDCTLYFKYVKSTELKFSSFLATSDINSVRYF